MTRHDGQRPERASECGTLFLATIAASALAVARRETVTESAWLYGTAALWLVPPWLLWGLAALRHDWERRLRGWRPWFLASWIVLPGIVEWIARRQGSGEAYEIAMLTSLQNAALVLGAVTDRLAWRRTSCLLSSFCMLFAVSISDRKEVGALAVAHGALALWWLMARYWERIHAAQTVVRVERNWRLRGVIVVGILGGMAIVGATLGAAAKSTHVLRGFLPTSGGDQASDPSARSGVGDGDAMVAAQEQSLSFGPVESDLFLEDKMSSLYDMLSDQYGDPPKPNKEQERSIALAPMNMLESEQSFAKTERNGREFSALRSAPRNRPTQLGDRTAPAMLYVVGPVPLHLALETYDYFDGTNWSHQQPLAASPPLRLEHVGGKPWIRLRNPLADGLFREPVRHALKIINLNTARVPSPPNLTSLHIDQLDQPDFFSWTSDGVVRMDGRERIPQLTVLHLASHALNLDGWRERFGSTASPGSRSADTRNSGPDAYRQLPPSTIDPERLARQWCADKPRGWRQVEAIVERLRRDFTVDREARAPAECRDVVDHFLRAGCGPDYLFASTAAVLLRSQGYSARLVSGLYARPERFDRRAGQTAVLAEDVHVWIEVCLDGRTWVTVEPTPGFDAPAESRTWRERLAHAVQFMVVLARRHWFAGLCLLASLTGLAAARHWWLDWLISAACRLAATGGSWERRVRGTIRLLEWRAWLAGRSRPANRTLGRWYGRALGEATDAQRQAFDGFLTLADAALYRPRGTADGERSAREAMLLCRVVESWFTVRRLRSHDFSSSR